MERKIMRGLPIAIALVLLVVLVAVFAVVGVHTTQDTANAEFSIAYMAWDEDSKTVKEVEGGCAEYTVVTDSTTTLVGGNWYVVSENVTISSLITVSGTVNLILCDGATLTAQSGIKVSSGNTLNVYAQSTGENMGAIVATGTGNAAGIGGDYGGTGGNVNIHGGVITATGDEGAAGIGGGDCGSGGNVNIYGGIITATGDEHAGGGCGGAGIGGGEYCNGGNVNIYGGVITATGGEGAAGIGGGDAGSSNGALTVAEGYVVYGGTSADPTTVIEKSDNDYARYQYMIVTGTGTGTAEDPYRIRTRAELEKFRDIVDGLNGETQDLNACAILTEDIDLYGSYSNRWTPIGSYDQKYNGHFDGDGHAIEGVYVNSTDSYQGLFGATGSDSVIENLTVSGSAWTSGTALGGIVGYACGTIRNCVNHVNVQGNDQSASNLGGIAGVLDGGAVTRCACDDAVTEIGTALSYVGGIVGQAKETCSITDCYNLSIVYSFQNGSGGIVGGCAADSHVTIARCFCYEANINCNKGKKGAIIGAETGAASISFENCYFYTDDEDMYGSGERNEPTAGITQKTAEQFRDSATFVGWDFNNVWIMDEKYPIFVYEFNGSMITIEIDDKEINYNEAAPSAYTYVAKIDGVAVTDTDLLAAIAEKLTITCAYAQGNDADTYAIINSNASYGEKFSIGSQNYKISTIIAGTLTVNKINSAISSPPEAVANLSYTGSAQTLISAGTATGGTMYYKVGRGEYATTPPQATNAGTYTVYYKVVGDSNHNDSAEDSLEVTIGATASIYEEIGSAYLDGADDTVIVNSNNGGTQDAPGGVSGDWNWYGYASVERSSYNGTDTALFTGSSIYFQYKNTSGLRIRSVEIVISDCSNYYVNATSPGNVLYNQNTVRNGENEMVRHVFNVASDGILTVQFAKQAGDANTFHLVGIRVYAQPHDVFTFDKNGGEGGDDSVICYQGDSAALITIEKPTKEGYGFGGYYDEGYSTKYFNANGKYCKTYIYGEPEGDKTLYAKWLPIMTVSAADYSGVYDGDPHTITVTVTVPSSDYTITYSADGSAYGSTHPECINASTYTIYYKVTHDEYATFTGTATVTINKADPDYTAPSAIANLGFDGDPHELVTAASTTIGTIQYSLDGENWSDQIPTGTNAGTYTVSYKITSGDDNYNDINGNVQATIAKADPTPLWPPYANTGLEYDGLTYNLVREGEVQNGTFYYSLDGENWSDERPEESNAGTYTVYYKVVGDPNYSDLTDPSWKVVVTIAKATAETPESYSMTIHVPYGGTLNDALDLPANWYWYNEKDTTQALYEDGSFEAVYNLDPNRKNYEDYGPVDLDVEIVGATLVVSVAQKEDYSYSGDPVEIELNKTEKVYIDETPYDVTYEFSVEDEYGIYGALPTFTDAGVYTVYYNASAEHHETYHGSFTVTIGKIYGLSEFYGATASNVPYDTYVGSIGASAAYDLDADGDREAFFALYANNNYTGLIDGLQYTLTFTLPGLDQYDNDYPENPLFDPDYTKIYYIDGENKVEWENAVDENGKVTLDGYVNGQKFYIRDTRPIIPIVVSAGAITYGQEAHYNVSIDVDGITWIEPIILVVDHYPSDPEEVTVATYADIPAATKAEFTSILNVSCSYNDNPAAGDFPISLVFSNETMEKSYNMHSVKGFRIVLGGGTLAVSKRTATIEWSEQKTLSYTGSAQAPSVTITNIAFGDDVTLTVSGKETNVGTGYTATVTGIINDNYILPTTGLSCDFSIVKATCNVEVTINGWAYGDTPNTPQDDYTVYDGTKVVEYKLSSADDNAYDTTVPSLPGEYTVRVSFPGTSNCEEASDTADFTISKAEINPTVTIEGWTYGDTPNTPSVVSGNPGNGAVTFRYSTDGDNFNLTAVSDAGEYYVAAFISETSNYESGMSDGYSFTIEQRPITVSGIAGVNKVYDGTPDATFNYANVVLTGNLDGENLSIIATGSFADKNVAAGKVVTFTLELDGTTKDNYCLADSGNQSTTTANITAREIVVSDITVDDKVYDGTTAANFNYANVVLDGKVANDDLTVIATGTFANANAENGKEVEFTLGLDGDDKGNYVLKEGENVQQSSATASITKKELTLAWSLAGETNGNKTVIYDNSEHTITVSVIGLAAADSAYQTAVNEAFNALIYGDKTKTNSIVVSEVDKYTATVDAIATYKVDGVNGNYTFDEDSCDWYINPKPITGATITLGSALTYSGTEQTQTVSSVVVDDITVTTYTVADNKQTNVGEENYTLTVTGTGNFTGSATKTWNIAKAQAVITTDPTFASGLVFNNDFQYLVTANGVSSFGSIVFSNTENGNYSGPMGVLNAGSYDVWYKVVGTDNYNGTTPVKQTVTIAQKPITDAEITLGAALTYDGTEQTQTVSSVVIDNLTATYDVSDNTGTDAGNNYTLTVTGTGNFTGSATKTWNIAKAQAVITTDPTFASGLVFNNDFQDLVTANGVSSFGSIVFCNTENGNYSGPMGVLNAGSYDVWYKVVGTDNYNGTNPVKQTVTIAQKPITGATITLGSALTYSGTEQTQTVSSVVVDDITVTTYTVAGNKQTNVGEENYTLTVTGTGNFTGSATKTWNIAKAQAVITTDPTFASGLVFNNDFRDLVTANGVSNFGTIGYSFSQDGPYSGPVGVLNAGSYDVWYKVVGTDNYNGTNPVKQTVTIAQKPITGATITLGSALIYNGEEQTQTITSVVIDNLTATYIVTDNTGTNAGNYTLTVTGNGNFTGSATKTWNIAKADLDFTVSINSWVYGNDIPNAYLYGSYGNATKRYLVKPVEDPDEEENWKLLMSVGSNLYPVEVGNYVLKVTSEENQNYNADEARTTFSIYTKQITVSGITVDDKTYDGTTAATFNYTNVVLTGNLDGNALSVVATGSFADKNVENEKTVEFTLALAGDKKNNYVLATTGQQSSATADITAREIVVSGIAVDNKVYDKTTVATFNYTNVVLTGNLDGNALSVVATGAFEDKDVETEKEVAFTLTLIGDEKDNYVLAENGQQTYAFADITAKEIVVSGIAVDDKIYDATTNATFNYNTVVLDGNLDGENLSVIATGAFTDKNVEAGKVVTFTLELDGTEKNNYVLKTGENVQQSSATAEITAKEIVVSGIAVDDKIYDATTNATFNYANVVLDGNLDGENLSVFATGAFADKNVEAGKVVTFTLELDGTEKNNYVLKTGENVQQSSATAEITAKEIVVSNVTVDERAYDGTVNVTFNYDNVVLDGKVVGDDLYAVVTGTLEDKNVGENKVVAFDTLTLEGTEKNNYVLKVGENVQQSSAVVDIVEKSIAVTIVNKTSVYGEEPVALSATTEAGAIEDGDVDPYTLACVVNNTSVVGTYDITGTDTSSNYAVTFVGEQNAYEVTKRPITATAQNKVVNFAEDEPLYTFTLSEDIPEDVLAELTERTTLTCDVDTAVSGRYDIVFAFAGEYETDTVLQNYSVTLAGGKLTVNSQYVSEGLVADGLDPDDEYEINRTDSDGENDNEKVVDIDITIKGDPDEEYIGEADLNVTIPELIDPEYFDLYKEDEDGNETLVDPEDYEITEDGEIVIHTEIPVRFVFKNKKGQIFVEADKKQIHDGDALPAYTFTVTGWDANGGELTPDMIAAVKAAVSGSTNYTSGDTGVFNITTSFKQGFDQYTVVNGFRVLLDNATLTVLPKMISDNNVEVTIENADDAFDLDITLEVEIKTNIQTEESEIDYKEIAAKFVDRRSEISAVYAVTLLQTETVNGVETTKEIQPEDIKPGTVLIIKMAVPEHLRGRKFHILHIHAADDVEYVDDSKVEVKDGFVYVKADRLSDFAFVNLKDNEEMGHKSFCIGWILFILDCIMLIYLVIHIVLKRRRLLGLIGLVASGAVVLFGILIICLHLCIITIVSFILAVLIFLAFLILFLLDRRNKKEEKEEETVQEEESAVVAAAEPEEIEEAKDGIGLKEGLALAAASTRKERINKAYVAAYLKKHYPDCVEVNRRGNYTKTGLPLADTHYVTVGGKICFIYVYETEGATMLLLKTKDALGEELAKEHSVVRKSAFPKAQDRWYSVIIDDSITNAQVEDMIDRTIALYTGKTAPKKTAYISESHIDPEEEGLSLRETLDVARHTLSHSAINKKYIIEYLKKYGDDAELNGRDNFTKTGLPLSDTHYAVRKDGKKVCFVYVYETGTTVLLLRLEPDYAEKLIEKHDNVSKSAFPKSKDHWYSLIIDDTFSNKEIERILDDAYGMAR